MGRDFGFRISDWGLGKNQPFARVARIRNPKSEIRNSFSEAAPNVVAPVAVVPEIMLGGGEVVILAIRPSGWFVLLASWPVALAATLVALALRWAGLGLKHGVPEEAFWVLWAAVVMGRLFAAGLQWMGRLYLLTNRRLVWVRGLMKFDVQQCPLTKVKAVRLTATVGERMLGLGSLSFESAAGPAGPGPWVNLSHPAKVRQEVEQAISRSAGGPG